MKIETKFDIGQEVYTVDCYRKSAIQPELEGMMDFAKVTIEYISFDRKGIEYFTSAEGEYREERVYGTIEDALEFIRGSYTDLTNKKKEEDKLLSSIK